MSTHEDPRYVRFGKPRKSLRSFDHEKLRPEAGLSCYEGWLVEPDLFMIDSSEIKNEVITTLIVLAASDWQAYFIAGEEVGRGGDNEPAVAVEDFWPVPRSTNITATDTVLQPALKLWSDGPRDGKAGNSGEVLVWRLQHGNYSPYLELDFAGAGIPEVAQSAPRNRSARRKPSNEQKRQRQARRANRKKQKR